MSPFLGVGPPYLICLLELSLLLYSIELPNFLCAPLPALYLTENSSLNNTNNSFLLFFLIFGASWNTYISFKRSVLLCLKYHSDSATYPNQAFLSAVFCTQTTLSGTRQALRPLYNSDSPNYFGHTVAGRRPKTTIGELVLQAETLVELSTCNVQHPRLPRCCQI